MPRFAANLGYLFTERPLLERIDAAAAAGFKAIELQFPYDVPARRGEGGDRAQQAHDARRQHAAGRRARANSGSRPCPAARRNGRRCFARALDYIAAIGGSADPLPGRQGAAGAAAGGRARLHRQSRRAPPIWPRRKNITLLIEPINPRDRPNYFLNRVEHAADIIAKVGEPNMRMQFDFYHVQIVGGDLIHRFEKYLPVIGHLQCAAVPSRHEPDEGEVNYPAVFEAVDRLGYSGWIGAEYRPRGRTEDGLGWARTLRPECRRINHQRR